MRFKKIAAFMCLVCIGVTAAACSGGGDKITVITREEGSGTRSAFVELFDVRDADKNDIIIDTAEQTNSTSVMITSVAGNKNAIGYISLGTLNSDVKAVSIDGAAATPGNVKEGSYAISRPFLIATLGTDYSEQAQDFINFILSKDGQDVAEANHYIRLDGAGAFTSNGASGKLVVGGSSSVSPLMEKLKEAYGAINGNVSIEIQTSDSSTGISNVLSGVVEIGMASRELKDSETEQGVSAIQIATDGLAVIVSNDNTVSNLTKEQVQKIYKGELTKWPEVK